MLWFHVAWRITAAKNGVSAVTLQNELGLGSYETAWSWLHKFRRAMVVPGRDVLDRTVEVDETFLGGVKHGARGRETGGKAIIAVAVESRETDPGQVRMQRIPDTSGDSLIPSIEHNVAAFSEVNTDAWTGYSALTRHPGYEHTVHNISQSDDEAHVAMPHVHRVIALLKRWLLGTDQGGISQEQLDYYMDEFSFRFNRRHSRYRGLLFYWLLEGAVRTPPQSYHGLKRPLGT